MEKTEIKVLFEDTDIIALNKPQGVLSIEGGYNPQEFNLRSFLREKYGDIWAVHRLDRLTSGVIVFAKNSRAHRILNEQFSNRTIKKEYRAVVHGSPFWEEKVITLPLLVDGDRKHRTIYEEKNGNAAETLVKIIAKQDTKSYLSIFPKTGFTHQIRSHLSLIGMPIIGDHLYGRFVHLDHESNKKTVKNPENFYLHACRIIFSHPSTSESIEIRADLPEYFEILLIIRDLAVDC